MNGDAKGGVAGVDETAVAKVPRRAIAPGRRPTGTRRFPEEIKLALLEAETWNEFQECELAVQEAGYEKATARRVALARYCPDELLPNDVNRADVDPQTAVRPRGRGKGRKNLLGGPEPKTKTSKWNTRDSEPPGNFDEDGDDDGNDEDGGETDPDSERAWPDIGGLVKEAERETTWSKKPKAKGKGIGELPDLPAVTRNQFRGKEANEIEVIRWVARNMDIRDVRPMDCPDAAAWRLLKRCRDSKLFEQLFWQSMWTKVVPTRTQLDKEAGPSEMDGTQEIATIDKVRVAAQKAKDAAAEAEKEAVAKMMSRRSGGLVPVGTDGDGDTDLGL